MKYLLIFISLITFEYSHCQETIIKGIVVEKGSKNILAYANIGIAQTKIGTISDKNGNFSLKVDSGLNKNTVITFSFIGYSNLELPISSLLQKNNVIELNISQNTLPEIVVGLKNPIKKLLGRASKGLGLMHTNFYSYYEKEPNDRLSKEMGMKFKIKNDCKIEDLNFNITSNDYKLVKFRLNFYSVKENFPNELLYNKDIVFTIDDGFMGWYKVDLKPYEIYLNKESEAIAVTIQWLESVKKNTESKYFSISTAISPNDTFYYREKGFDKWTKTNSSLSFYLNTISD